jgi:saccharopine dehydrogenase (NAD+, L-lysine-forming)
MKVAVLGGTGSMGRWAAKALVSEGLAEEVVIGSRSLAKAEALAREIGGPCRAARMDVDVHEEIVRSVQGCDVVLGMVGPFYKYEVKMVRAVIEAGAHYVSIGDDAEVVEGFLAQDEEAKRRNVTAISGVGATPGMANLFARMAADALDEVDGIAIRWAVSPSDGGGRAGVHHVLHTLTGMTPCFLDGRRVEKRAGSEAEKVRFPDPMGVQIVFFTGHQAAVTLPRTISARTVTVKGGLADPLLVGLVRTLVRLGLTNSERKKAAVAKFAHSMLPLAEKIRRPGNAGSALRVDVTGRANGKPVRRAYGAWGHMAPWTVIPCLTAVEMLGEGEIVKKGAMPPETCIDPVPFFKRCMARGLDLWEGDAMTTPLRL